MRRSKRDDLIPYQLPTGNTIWVTYDMIDNMSMQDLTGLDSGEYVDDPFTGSTLVGTRVELDDDEFLLGLPEEDIDLSFGEEE